MEEEVVIYFMIILLVKLQGVVVANFQLLIS
jgi:hypothetical protein